MVLKIVKGFCGFLQTNQRKINFQRPPFYKILTKKILRLKIDIHRNLSTKNRRSRWDITGKIIMKKLMYILVAMIYLGISTSCKKEEPEKVNLKETFWKFPGNLGYHDEGVSGLFFQSKSKGMWSVCSDENKTIYYEKDYGVFNYEIDENNIWIEFVEPFEYDEGSYITNLKGNVLGNIMIVNFFGEKLTLTKMNTEGYDIEYFY